jgi:hypothetical protein
MNERLRVMIDRERDEGTGYHAEPPSSQQIEI